MIKISYSGYRFPPEIIQHAIWLYIRFTLSFRAETNDAICANQICRSAGSSDAAPDARLADSPAQRPYQRHSCGFLRIRHRGWTGIRNVERLLVFSERQAALAAEMLGILVAQLRDVAEHVKEVEVKLLAWHRADATSRRLQSVPGLEPITASAIVATVGDPTQFKSGRRFAAWLGQQRSSGGKERLRGISKRGDGYIRRLLVHGARAIVGWRKRSATHKTPWIEQLLPRGLSLRG